MILRRSPRLAAKRSPTRRLSAKLKPYTSIVNLRRSPRIIARNLAKTWTFSLTKICNKPHSLGVIDPESNIKNGSIHVMREGANKTPCDVMMTLIDPARNMDKFYVLQLIDIDDGSNAVFTRWGRTGTKGQSLTHCFDSVDDALAWFQQKFRQKTGLAWSHRHSESITGKYKFILQDFTQKEKGYTEGKWQYWVDDYVDGKSTGWYDYTTDGNYNMEVLYHENLYNKNCHQRVVASGFWTYHVDLNEMTQTNATHMNHKSRMIRRIRVC